MADGSGNRLSPHTRQSWIALLAAGPCDKTGLLRTAENPNRCDFLQNGQVEVGLSKE